MRSTLINIAVLLCSIVVAFFLGEGVVRILDAFTPCPALDAIPDPLVWHLRPPYQDVHLRCDEFETLYRTNSSGFRGPEFPSMEKPDGINRIVFLGDSFVEAIEVEEDERFPRLVESTLEEKTDAVILGYAGSSPVHALAYYRHIGRRYKPNLVVHAFYSVNDIVEHEDDFSSSDGGIDIQLHPDENWRLKLGRSSLLVQLIYDRVYRPVRLALIPKEISIRDAAGSFYNFTKDGFVALEENGAWEYTRAVMRTLQNEVEADGAEFLVVMIPPYFLVHEERKDQVRMFLHEYIAEDQWDFTSTYERLIVELRNEGIQIIDPTAALSKVYKEGERVYFRVDPHITKRGHQIVADEILRAILSP